MTYGGRITSLRGADGRRVEAVALEPELIRVDDEMAHHDAVCKRLEMPPVLKIDPGAGSCAGGGDVVGRDLYVAGRDGAHAVNCDYVARGGRRDRRE